VILDNAQVAKLNVTPFLDEKFQERAGSVWQALFNPTQLSLARKNKYNKTASQGAKAPDTSYAGGDPDQLALDLFFDGTGVLEQAQSVSERVGAFLHLIDFHGEKHEPYRLEVRWGNFVFYGVLTQADVSYTLFDREGRPLRATVKATFMEVKAPELRHAEERRASPDLYQTWLVSDGDRIDLIANKVYGDPKWWRPLAAANDLRNPRALEVGSVLLLPPMVKG